jgi:RNA polymerase sigma factor (sigma-70 family)
MDVESASGAAIEVLLDNHRAFLRYLERRVGDRAIAEDILQDAFARTIARPDHVPGDEGIVPWFYRLLKNATIDQFRRRASAARALEAFAGELERSAEPMGDIRNEICGCVTRLAGTLKPEYSQVLNAVDIEGLPVKTFAANEGMTANNAGVRLFRAREALRRRVAQSCGVCADHGCVDCTCKTAPHPEGAAR